MTLTRKERFGLGLLLAIFTWFTWRGMTMFFSGDDMTNMYNAWNIDIWTLARAQILLWMPVYRPLGAAVYRLFYSAFGFHPAPLYVFCWLLLAGNVLVAYRLFRSLTGAAEALTALSLVLVHGSFNDLYYSAGTIYDRLCFLFTVAALIAYLDYSREASRRSFVLVCIFTVLAMGAKESAAVILPLIVCCECVLVSSGNIRRRPREIAPLFAALTVLSLIFVFGRVKRTPELLTNPQYAPHAAPGVWLGHIAEYLSILTYRRVHFSAMSAGLLLASMGLIAILARSRTMVFGWLFFVLSITPVALITLRPGYVLYLPELGLGLFVSAAIAATTRPFAHRIPQAGGITFAIVTIVLTWIHWRNWPAPPQITAELRMTQQFRREYPKLPPHSRLLFARDEFPPAAWDLQFNLALLYHDKSFLIHRLDGTAEQRPDPARPVAYDHIFSLESGRYVELDPRNPAESVRLNILRDYTVGREMDMARADHSAYVVSGLQDDPGNQPWRWTSPQAKFKFRPGAGPAVFTAKFWVPDFLAKPPDRTLTILLNGKTMWSSALARPGMNEVSFPVPQDLIHPDGYTFIDMNVANPYRDTNGVQYGVVLLRAGFKELPGRAAL